MILATVTGWTALAIAATFVALVLISIWDCRRTFGRVDQRFSYLDKPVEIEATSKDFNYRRELRVKDRSRRGPEVEAHWGKTRIGRDRGRAA